MKFNRIAQAGAIAAVAALTLVGCASNEGDAPADDTNSNSAEALSGSIAGQGSSAQGVAETTWIAGFQTANNDKVTVNYDPQGSGAGRKAFIGGTVDYAGSDAALSDDELAAGGFQACAADSSAIDLPLYISPIAVAYNVAGVDDLKLDATTIAKIFKGDITKWDDEAIKALNPDAALPSADIVVVHRSDDSGTTQNFVEYLKANAGDVWDAEISQTFPYEIGDASKGTSGVAEATKAAANSITYIDESGADGLQIAQLKVGDNFVELSPEGAAAVVAASPIAEGRSANDLAIALDRTAAGENDWPMVLVSYVIACEEYKDPAKGKLVSEFVKYAASDEAQQAAAVESGSAPLSAELSAKVIEAAGSIK